MKRCACSLPTPPSAPSRATARARWEVGKQGDLVLLAEDPMTVPDHIKDIKVLLTVHNGEIVYRG